VDLSGPLELPRREASDVGVVPVRGSGRHHCGRARSPFLSLVRNRQNADRARSFDSWPTPRTVRSAMRDLLSSQSFMGLHAQFLLFHVASADAPRQLRGGLQTGGPRPGGGQADAVGVRLPRQAKDVRGRRPSATAAGGRRSDAMGRLARTVRLSPRRGLHGFVTLDMKPRNASAVVGLLRYHRLLADPANWSAATLVPRHSAGAYCKSAARGTATESQRAEQSRRRARMRQSASTTTD
jgi:hypothetical protein